MAWQSLYFWKEKLSKTHVVCDIQFKKARHEWFYFRIHQIFTSDILLVE